MNATYYHNKWSGLMVRVLASIQKVKGSNLMNGVLWLTDGMLTEYSFI
jgi:hypothetical protein